MKVELPANWWACPSPQCNSYNAPGVRDCPRCGHKRATPVGRMLELAEIPTKPMGKVKKSKGPNKTEQEYNNVYLLNKGRFQGLSFNLSNGHRYTPDWVMIRDNVVWCYETKGGYKHPSHNRSRCMFDLAKAEYPMMQFRWCEKKNGKWKVEE
jgi:hypothetical protein